MMQYSSAEKNSEFLAITNHAQDSFTSMLSGSKESHVVKINNKSLKKAQKEETNLNTVKEELQENIENFYKIRKGSHSVRSESNYKFQEENNFQNIQEDNFLTKERAGHDEKQSNPAAVKITSDKNLSSEELRMQRINSNYEHDRAILAKTDPEFMAKDQMHGIGHANGEEIDFRYIKKISSSIAKNKLDELEQ